MRTFTLNAWLFAVVLLPLSGCDVLMGILPLGVTVSLVNDSDYAVEGTIFYDDEDDVPEILLREIGEELEFTVAAGATFTFVRSCEDLQSIMIDEANLMVIGDVGPDANTDVLHDGDEFTCGSTIVFTFDHSAAILDFDIETSVAGF